MPAWLTLNAAGALLGKIWPFLGVAVLLLVIYFQHTSLNAAKEFRHSMQTELSAPDSSTGTLLRKAHAIVAESADRLAHLTTISAEASAANLRSTQADTALMREQEANARRFAVAQRRIADLQSRRASGNAAQDLHTIEEDSQAAWRGWR